MVIVGIVTVMMTEKVSNFSDIIGIVTVMTFGSNFSGNCWNSHCDDD